VLSGFAEGKGRVAMSKVARFEDLIA